MINQKRKKNKLSVFIFLITITLLPTFIYADSIECKKFDIKCKSKKWVNETKDFQKKKFDESRNQFNKKKEIIEKTLKRK